MLQCSASSIRRLRDARAPLAAKEIQKNNHGLPDLRKPALGFPVAFARARGKGSRPVPLKSPSGNGMSLQNQKKTLTLTYAALPYESLFQKGTDGRDEP
jgi:hypothetical protein